VGSGGTTGGSGGTAGSGGTTGGTAGGANIPDGGCPADAGSPEPICPGAPNYSGICFSPAALARYLKVDAGGGVCGPRTVCPTQLEFASQFHCFQSIVGGGTPPNTDGQCCYGYIVDGRPFIVEGRARQALAVERTDWCSAYPGSEPPRARDGRDASDDELTTSQRERLAEIWLDDALAEHASIASFARLTLQLLSLGAPPELLTAAQRATQDEIEHAKLCFELASRYRGRLLGPSQLPMHGVVADLTLVDLAVAAVHEGCVGETTAAVLAGERLERARDPRVRAALGKIVEDETRHAELAWRTVAWAIEQGGESVRRAVRAAFDEALDRDFAPTVGDERAYPNEALLAHGYADAATMRHVKAVVAREVLKPLCATLFVRPSAGLARRGVDAVAT
jgi:rubrerythrin